MKNRPFVLIVVLCSIAYWALLFFRLPILQSLPWWFWKFRDTPLSGLLYLAVGIAIAAAGVALVLYTPQRRTLNLVLLIVAGYTLQLAFGLADGRGVESLRDRVVRSGQIECMRVAVGRYELLDFARHYEDYLHHSELWRYDYIRTKPPGTTLFFMTVERTTNWFFGAQTEQKRMENLTTVGMFLFPFLAVLTVVPLFFFSRFFLPERHAMIPAVLYIFCPNAVLLTMSIDQFLFPLASMVVLWLGGLSSTRANPAIAFFAGAALYVSVYLSFSVLSLLLLCPLVIIILRASGEPTRRSLKTVAALLGTCAAGFLAALVLFRIALQYDMITRFSAAIAAHEDIKSWMPGIENVITFAFVNYVEFAFGVGIALTIVFLDQLGSTAIDLTHKEMNSVGLLATVLVTILLALGILGKVKAETARLWLYLVPVVCVVVAGRLLRRFPTSPVAALLLIISLQLVTTVLLKRYEDLWRPLI